MVFWKKEDGPPPAKEPPLCQQRLGQGLQLGCSRIIRRLLCNDRIADETCSVGKTSEACVLFSDSVWGCWRFLLLGSVCWWCGLWVDTWSHRH